MSQLPSDLQAAISFLKFVSIPTALPYIAQIERALASIPSAIESIPVSEIEAEIDHIKQNADGLRRFKGEENEARCRELCAMYLREFIQSWRFGQQLAAMNSSAKPSTDIGESR